MQFLVAVLLASSLSAAQAFVPGGVALHRAVSRRQHTSSSSTCLNMWLGTGKHEKVRGME